MAGSLQEAGLFVSRSLGNAYARPPSLFESQISNQTGERDVFDERVHGAR